MHQFRDSDGQPGQLQSAMAPTPSILPALVRQLDLLVLLVSLPVFLVASLPMGGWAVAAGAWVLQRIVQVILTRRAAASTDPRTTVGLMAASMIARGWMVAIAIFLVGLDDNRAGLAAAVLVVALFTIYFTTGMIMRPLSAPLPQPRATPAGRSTTPAAAVPAGATIAPALAPAGAATAPTVGPAGATTAAEPEPQTGARIPVGAAAAVGSTALHAGGDPDGPDGDADGPAR